MIDVKFTMGQDYENHEVFKKLNLFSEFYSDLSDNVMKYVSMGTQGILNIDTYAYTSIQGTLESIHSILLNGRINDAYALLRKYYDSALINVYCQIYLQDNFSIENFVVDHINNWIKGTEKIPEIREIQNYLSKSKKLSSIYTLLKSDKRYKAIRGRGNDHTHYNFFKFAMLNDNRIYIKSRTQELSQFSQDLEDIFILHFAYIFTINDHYMSSSDHVDHLEMGMKPPEDSQYWVAPFIQTMFDDVIKKSRPDIAKEILSTTAMKLV